MLLPSEDKPHGTKLPDKKRPVSIQSQAQCWQGAPHRARRVLDFWDFWGFLHFLRFLVVFHCFSRVFQGFSRFFNVSHGFQVFQGFSRFFKVFQGFSRFLLRRCKRGWWLEFRARGGFSPLERQPLEFRARGWL